MLTRALPASPKGAEDEHAENLAAACMLPARANTRKCLRSSHAKVRMRYSMQLCEQLPQSFDSPSFHAIGIATAWAIAEADPETTTICTSASFHIRHFPRLA
jgi:hypothetical protein